MLPASSVKSIDPNLSSLAQQIEQQNPGLSVAVARQFRLAVRQTPLEVTVSEPRKFNVLEEFVLRAAIEFVPPPTLQELADLLGLDEIFVRSTATNLASLETVAIGTNGEISIAPQGRNFFDRGGVSESQVRSIYAVSDPLNRTLTFNFEPLVAAEITDLPDVADLIPLQHQIADFADLSIAEIQPLIQASGLGIHVPESGQIVSQCDVIGDDLDVWQTVSIFVLLDAIEHQTTIQVRQGKQILETASNLLDELASQQKLSFDKLCELTESAIPYGIASLNEQEAESVNPPKTRKRSSKKK
ncbi:MAG: hypothetical protein ACRC62_18935 [Microcoleus sp.]